MRNPKGVGYGREGLETWADITAWGPRSTATGCTVKTVSLLALWVVSAAGFGLFT